MPGFYAGDVVPIKVRIPLRPNGHADHPDWTQLPLSNGGQVDPVTHMRGGWIYDRCGHHDEDAESPIGVQFGMLLVSEQFADEAVAMFPGVVEKVLDEQDVETWIEERATKHLPDFKLDRDELQALAAERDLLEKTGQPVNEVDSRINKALDPDHPAPGRRRMANKRWVDLKGAAKLSRKVKAKRPS